MATFVAVGIAVMVIVAFAYESYVNDSANTDVRVPELSGGAARGAEIFAAKCASCHGSNAGGSSKGPPLVHRYYEPNHHADFAFYAAVRQGVRSHHWQFGDMPPVPDMNERSISFVVRYVRELQKANGVF